MASRLALPTSRCNSTSSLLTTRSARSSYLTQHSQTRSVTRVTRPIDFVHTIVRCYCYDNILRSASAVSFVLVRLPAATMPLDTDSDTSSALSSPPPSPTLGAAASSPLSSLASSPEPPEELFIMPKRLKRSPEVLIEYLPSPPASQEPSQTGSPTPDGMESGTNTDKDGPPPAKRRRVSKERTTRYLDLRHSNVKPSQQDQMEDVLNVLHKRQKIVVIAGAGISVSAGSMSSSIPTCNLRPC